MAQTQHVAGNRVPGRAKFGRLAQHVGHHLLLDLLSGALRSHLAIEQRVPFAQPPGVVVGLTPDHDAVDLLQLGLHLLIAGQAAIDLDLTIRKIKFELMHQAVAQRRHFSVFFGAQALQPGIASVHDEGVAAGLVQGTHKVTHKVVALGAINANAVLDRDRDAHHVEHGLDAVGHQSRLSHQAGAKRAALHALAGAAAVEVDLVIAPLLTQARAVR